MNPKKCNEVRKRSDGVYRQYSAALSMPNSVISDYTKLIQKWYVNNGPEWTVARCKDIYTDWIRFRAGLPPVGTWYAKDHLGLPKGVIGAVFRISTRNPKMRFQASVLLRSYTQWLSPSVTEKQLGKFLSGVNSQAISVPTGIVEGVRKAARKAVGRLDVGDPSPYWLYQPSTGKRVPHWNGRTYPEHEYWNSQYLTLYLSRTGRTVRKKYPDLVQKVLNGQTGTFESTRTSEDSDLGYSTGHTIKGHEYDYVGRLGSG